MEDIKRSYIAIIPADVRYDDSLCANAKLMYGEISALANERGYCWASNAYFAKLYNKSKDSISRWISELEKAGHITVEISSADGNTRKLYLNLAIGNGKKAKRVSAKMPKGYGKNTEHISIDNSIVNNIDNSVSANAQTRDFESSKNKNENQKEDVQHSLNESKNTKLKRPDALKKVVISAKEVAEYCGLQDRPGLIEAFDRYLEHRIEYEWPVYKSVKSACGALRKLNRLSIESKCTPAEIVEQSVTEIWRGLFNLKTNNNKKADEFDGKRIQPYAEKQLF